MIVSPVTDFHRRAQDLSRAHPLKDREPRDQLLSEVEDLQIFVHFLDGFIFPSEKVLTPLSVDNLWRGCMLPKLNEIGLGWGNFQVLRKTNASLSNKAGVDLKSASDPRSHGFGVSPEVYTSSDLEGEVSRIKVSRSRRALEPDPKPQPSKLTKLA